MIIDTYYQDLIDKQLIADNKAREAKHTSSGLLSASMLYQPLRFQVMKSIGIPTKKFEPYLLGKFKRGNDVEDWFVERMKKILVDTQVEVKYRGAIGYLDAILKSDKAQFKKGNIPHEVKSVTNAKLKRITKTEVDYHFKLQACFYALGLKSEYYALDIISAEDLRVNTYIFQTRLLTSDVNKTIESYDKAMKDWKEKQILPKFEVNPKVPWTKNLAYAPFEEKYLKMTDKDLIKQL